MNAENPLTASCAVEHQDLLELRRVQELVPEQEPLPEPLELLEAHPQQAQAAHLPVALHPAQELAPVQV